MPIGHPQRLDLDDLQGIDRAKAALDRNTRQFLAGAPANDALLWGSRGTGKSSLVKALLTRHAAVGLRLIEVDKDHLVDLPDIAAATAGLPYRFIVFCDDLSFGSDEPAYKALKVALDGSISGGREHLLIYATSNRRHLLPEYQEENALTRHVGQEIHFSEAVEEKSPCPSALACGWRFMPSTRTVIWASCSTGWRSSAAGRQWSTGARRPCAGR